MPNRDLEEEMYMYMYMYTGRLRAAASMDNFEAKCIVGPDPIDLPNLTETRTVSSNNNWVQVSLYFSTWR